MTALKVELEDSRNGIDLSASVHKDFQDILSASSIDEPLAKMFWEEQVKAFSKKDRGMRWHPMMIRLAILLHCQSPSAYRTLRDTGVLKLPGESTLRDYSNVMHPEQGFNSAVMEELLGAIKDLVDSQRFVVLLHDEMSIKQDLVFDQRTDELVGFINPTTSPIKDDNLVTHILLFMVVGINSTFKMSMGFFATKTVTADELYPLLWQAIGYLEIVCKLKVIVSTSDKASPNQRLYRLHGDDNSLCFKAVNLYARDRHVYFISDVPHLVKTVRNNLAASGSGKNTRLLWVSSALLLGKEWYPFCPQKVIHSEYTCLSQY